MRVPPCGVGCGPPTASCSARTGTLASSAGTCSPHFCAYTSFPSEDQLAPFLPGRGAGRYFSSSGVFLADSLVPCCLCIQRRLQACSSGSAGRAVAPGSYGFTSELLLPSYVFGSVGGRSKIAGLSTEKSWLNSFNRH